MKKRVGGEEKEEEEHVHKDRYLVVSRDWSRGKMQAKEERFAYNLKLLDNLESAALVCNPKGNYIYQGGNRRE